jgi:hypothetical protein
MYEHLILAESEIQDELSRVAGSQEYREVVERLPASLQAIQRHGRETWYIAALGWLASQAALIGHTEFKVHRKRHPLVSFIYYARRFFLESYEVLGKNEESESLYNTLFMDFSDPFPEMTNEIDEAEQLAKQGWRPLKGKGE